MPQGRQCASLSCRELRVQLLAVSMSCLPPLGWGGRAATCARREKPGFSGPFVPAAQPHTLKGNEHVRDRGRTDGGSSGAQDSAGCRRRQRKAGQALHREHDAASDPGRRAGADSCLGKWEQGNRDTGCEWRSSRVGTHGPGKTNSMPAAVGLTQSLWGHCQEGVLAPDSPAGRLEGVACAQ